MKPVPSMPLRVVALLVNLFTLTGGLLIRRHWRSALYCGAVIAACGAFNWLLQQRFDQALIAPDADESPAWRLYLHIAYLLSIAAVALFACARCVLAGTPPPTSRAMREVACVICFLALAITYRVFPEARFYVQTDLRQGGFNMSSATTDEEYERERLGQDINFKDPTLWGRNSLPLWPGSGAVTGVVRYQGEPAQVTIKLFLDQHWRTYVYRSNSRGEFRVPLPSGRWEINRIELDKWFNKPEGEGEYFVRLRQPQLTAETPIFNEVRYTERLPIDTRSPRAGYDLEIDINPQIRMLWPLPSEQIQEASLEQGEIAWETVGEAAYYKVELSEYDQDREGGQRVRTLQVEANSLPLTEVPTRSSEATKEYAVKVMAYDQQGTLLTASPDVFGEMFMRISGHEVIPDADAYTTCHKPRDTSD